MPRKPRPIPPDFRLAVVVEKLGYFRLKRKYKAGGETIKRWLNELHLKTHSAPRTNLDAYNRYLQLRQRQSDLDSTDATNKLMLGLTQERTSLKTARSPILEARAPSIGARTRTSKSGRVCAFSEEQLEHARRRIVGKFQNAVFPDHWEETPLLLKELDASALPHQTRHRIFVTGVEFARNSLAGSTQELAFRALGQWVSRRCLAPKQLDAEAVLLLACLTNVLPLSVDAKESVGTIGRSSRESAEGD